MYFTYNTNIPQNNRFIHAEWYSISQYTLWRLGGGHFGCRFPESSPPPQNGEKSSLAEIIDFPAEQQQLWEQLRLLLSREQNQEAAEAATTRQGQMGLPGG